jgi:hypothetical protein
MSVSKVIIYSRLRLPHRHVLLHPSLPGWNTHRHVLQALFCRYSPASHDVGLRFLLCSLRCRHQLWWSLRTPLPARYLRKCNVSLARFSEHVLICRLPGVVYYLSTFYTRGELAGRVGIFYSMSMMANAFSGLLAFGVSCRTSQRPS